MSTPAKNSWVVRIGTMLFSAAFALGFGAGGFLAGLKPLYQTLSAAWEVRTWQRVPAQVLETRLDSRRGSKGSETYAVQVRYRYQVGPQTYESQRVGLDADGHSDNVDNWHAQWHRRLQAAQSSGQAITAWVNPRAPAQALLDPHIRWPMLAFRLPFALVFTGVGLAAGWVFFKALRGQGAHPATPDAAEGGQQRMGGSVRKSAGMLWLFALFWCGLSFPAAALFWAQDRPWLVKAFILLFVLVGLGLITWATRQTRLAWRHAHTALVLRPATSRAGQPLEVALNLSERALHDQGQQPRVLRLAQYRVADSGSGESSRLVEHLEQLAHVQSLPDGSARLVARFSLPDDAPSHGARRSGERVDWRLELMYASGDVELSHDLAVQGSSTAVGADRFADRTDWNRESPVSHANPNAGLSDWPTQAGTVETDGYRGLEFSQAGSRWVAGVLLLPFAVLLFQWAQEWAPRLPLLQRWSAWPLWGLGLLLALILHRATRRWSVLVHDQGLAVRRVSWLWSRQFCLLPSALDHLSTKLQYSASTGGSEMQEFHAVLAREADGTKAQRITPGVAGEAGAHAVAQWLQGAWHDRAGRFTPGHDRILQSAHSRPRWGWLLWAAMMAILLLGARGG
ncbi:MAG: DUF3592 domain-containing protein [Burkholderiales bacterium]|nr:DUF3592 domain-containing protein [Burkholderiales bacterium]